jgi:hypothetical protein
MFAKVMIIRRLLVFAAAVSFLLASSLCAQESSGAIFAVSDGKGRISLLWFPPPSSWPSGGWKLSDSVGQVVAPQIKMGDAAALKALSVEDADAVGKLLPVLAKPDASPQHKNLIAILALKAFSDINYARALGLAWSMDNVGPGSRIYKVEALDDAGKTIGLQLTSAAVDSTQATAPPPAPADVQAKGDQSGVALGWTPAAENRQLPVISYAIERDGGGQSGALVNAKPVIVGTHWDPKLPLFLDRNAPGNDTLTYHVFSVDVFGRRSAGSTVRIFYPDFRALAPPEPVSAMPGIAKIVLAWKAEKKANLAGYIVERSFLESGPYEVLTPQALPPETAQYEDATVRGGSAYYYRVRAVNSRGDLGNPSSAVMAQPKNPAPPPKVEGLTADLGQTRVRLTWKAVSFPVAGYFVERRGIISTAGPVSWARLNSHVTPEPLYDDYLGLSSDTKMEYRIVPVAFDNAEGPASNAVQVAVADRSVPFPPSITDASGAGGKALLSFMPASPPEKTAQFLVVRGASAKDPGVVIGDPLPASARQFTDLYVSPGQNYWYRLVAVDKNGNRSDPTPPVAVHIGAPPAPSAP